MSARKNEKLESLYNDLVDSLTPLHPCPSCEIEMDLELKRNREGYVTYGRAVCPQCGYSEQLYP